MLTVTLKTGKIFQCEFVLEAYNSRNELLLNKQTLALENTDVNENLSHYIDMLTEDSALTEIKITSENGATTTYNDYTFEDVSIKVNEMTGKRYLKILLSKPI